MDRRTHERDRWPVNRVALLRSIYYDENTGDDAMEGREEIRVFSNASRRQ